MFFTSSGKYSVMEEKTKEYSTRMQLHIKDFQVRIVKVIYFQVIVDQHTIKTIILKGVRRGSLHLHIDQFLGQNRRLHSAVCIYYHYLHLIYIIYDLDGLAKDQTFYDSFFWHSSLFGVF